MEKNIQKYIELVLRKGINIQKGQILVINSPVEISSFTRKVVEMAYKLEASEVIIKWRDEVCDKYKYLYAENSIFDFFPNWAVESVEYYRKKGAAFLSICADNPDILKTVDKNRVSRYQKARGIALKEYYKAIMGNSNQWCVIGVPSVAWAKKIFPELEEKDAILELWKLILKIVRADTENPILEWEKHLKILSERTDFLNKKHFKKLIYKNSLGTNLEIELPKEHKWVSGGEKTNSGIEFVANIPTEEIFTMPHKMKVNGIVVSSKPLIYAGTVIDKFTLTFKDGKVVDFSSKSGGEVLEKLLNIDENSKYLGEVALVEYNSPISLSEKIFFNTLFDENASCHLAFGEAYPVCINVDSNISEDKLEKLGMNFSLTHEDFMIGTKDMEIIGIDEDGKKTQIMKCGNFCF